VLIVAELSRLCLLPPARPPFPEVRGERETEREREREGREQGEMVTGKGAVRGMHFCASRRRENETDR
jgi:hypothetical protein